MSCLWEELELVLTLLLVNLSVPDAFGYIVYILPGLFILLNLLNYLLLPLQPLLLLFTHLHLLLRYGLSQLQVSQLNIAVTVHVDWGVEQHDLRNLVNTGRCDAQVRFRGCRLLSCDVADDVTLDGELLVQVHQISQIFHTSFDTLLHFIWFVNHSSPVYLVIMRVQLSWLWVELIVIVH